MWRIVFFALLLSSVVHSQADEEEDIYEAGEDEIEERAFLVAQKKILEAQIPDGTNVTVLLTIHNAGTRAAAKIVIQDPPPPEKMEVLSTEVESAAVHHLSPGLTLRYRTVLRPMTTGPLVIQPAKLTYAPAVGSIEEQTGYSTPAFLTVLTTNEYLGTKILMLGSYMTLGILRTKMEWLRFGILMSVAGLLFTMNYLWKKLSEARRERLRRTATEFIEKSK